MLKIVAEYIDFPVKALFLSDKTREKEKEEFKHQNVD